VTSWLPSVRVLGELRAATITYRAIVRSHLLATDEAGKQLQEESARKVDHQHGQSPQNV